MPVYTDRLKNKTTKTILLKGANPNWFTKLTIENPTPPSPPRQALIVLCSYHVQRATPYCVQSSAGRRITEHSEAQETLSSNVYWQQGQHF